MTRLCGCPPAVSLGNDERDGLALDHNPTWAGCATAPLDRFCVLSRDNCGLWVGRPLVVPGPYHRQTPRPTWPSWFVGCRDLPVPVECQRMCVCVWCDRVQVDEGARSRGHSGKHDADPACMGSGLRKGHDSAAVRRTRPSGAHARWTHLNDTTAAKGSSVRPLTNMTSPSRHRCWNGLGCAMNDSTGSWVSSPCGQVCSIRTPLVTCGSDLGEETDRVVLVRSPLTTLLPARASRKRRDH